MTKRVVQVAVLCGVAALPLAAQQPPASCEVKVSTPRPGKGVGREGTVGGTARIPNGTYLWVLAHRKDLTRQWWPQGGGPASIDPQTRSWVVTASYGRLEDVGKNFEVAVVVVDEDTNYTLQNWFNDAAARDYPPIEFPTPIDGCPPIKVVVNKTSHR